MASANSQVIRGLYEAFAKGDIPGVLGAMAPGIVWNEAENFPYADRNPYVGPQAVLEGVFGRIGADFEGFAATPEEVLDAGDKIVALGRYTGTVKATGKAVSVQFAHVWTVTGGKAAAFQQYADTLQMTKAMGR
jgi:uncharacterized protein